MAVHLGEEFENLALIHVDEHRWAIREQLASAVFESLEAWRVTRIGGHGPSE